MCCARKFLTLLSEKLTSQTITISNAWIVHRPPTDTIVRFLLTQYENHGESFIVYMFGKKAAQLFHKMDPIDAFGIIAKYLAGDKKYCLFS